MNKFTKEDFNNFQKFYRANFINSLSGFKSANLIGTISKEGKTNLSLFSSAFHLGADPALIGLIQRPTSVRRDTFENLCQTNYLTINHINKDIINKSHLTSARFDQDECEFEKCNLTKEFKDDFIAPFVKESRLQIACSLNEIIDIKANNTKMLILNIESVYLNNDIILENGTIDIEKIESVAISSLDSYHSTTLEKRLKYAKENY
ncbi:MAG: flavin reductase [Bacteriovoracaceae bacterium]|jgi:flavin reductase (DIM6/NTAB) family NADH-FMN oxidoreductase RutF|nr:flavin reductase [Bacteriovoracaceae bacterium]